VSCNKDKLATGFFASTATDVAHTHNAKLIGENFPENGYGVYHLPTKISCCPLQYGSWLPSCSRLDHFYAFNARSILPSRIPISTFCPELDLLADLLVPSSLGEVVKSRTTPEKSGCRGQPVVELVSEKSGVKLAFDTNRTLTSSLL
jgi:aldose 1-epimerase